MELHCLTDKPSAQLYCIILRTAQNPLRRDNKQADPAPVSNFRHPHTVMDATHSYNPSSTREDENNSTPENLYQQHQYSTTTRFLPPIDAFDDSLDEEEDDDMPPGIMIDELSPLPPRLFIHDDADEDMPPSGIVNNMLDTQHRKEGRVGDDPPPLVLPPATLSRDGSGLTNDGGNPSRTINTPNNPARTGPLTFNYTFLPDMSLATASDGSPGARITEVASDLSGLNPENTAYSSFPTVSGVEYDSGAIHSVAYPTYPTSYPPTSYHHIPRPPNAFILFRSAFIRSRKISSEIEGNHSTLSKIIGRVWRSLPPPERAEWEARARIAQEEHRLRYPDWRFSPAGGGSGGGGKSRSKGNRGKGRGRGRGRGRLKAGQGGGDSVTSSAGNEASADMVEESSQDKGNEEPQEVNEGGLRRIQLVPRASSSTSMPVNFRTVDTLSNPKDPATTSTQTLSTSSASCAIVVDDPLEISTRQTTSNLQREVVNADVVRTLSANDSNSNILTSSIDQSHGSERESEQPREQGGSETVAIDSFLSSASTLYPSVTAIVKNETDARVDAIADMLAQGFEGRALEVAVREWEVADEKQKERKRKDLERKERREGRERGMKEREKRQGKAKEMDIAGMAAQKSHEWVEEANAGVRGSANTSMTRQVREMKVDQHRQSQNPGEDRREDETESRRSEQTSYAHVPEFGVEEGFLHGDFGHHGWLTSYSPEERVEVVGEVPSEFVHAYRVFISGLLICISSYRLFKVKLQQ